jgi:hypothetical protein
VSLCLGLGLGSGLAEADAGHEQATSTVVPATCVRHRQVALGTLSAAEWLLGVSDQGWARRWQESDALDVSQSRSFSREGFLQWLRLFTNHDSTRFQVDLWRRIVRGVGGERGEGGKRQAKLKRECAYAVRDY